jgi:hypothetical protein
MCAAGGLGASLPAVALGPMAQQALQLPTPPTGSRICQGSLASDVRWNRVVLFGPGNPAQVRVGVFRMPSR